MIIDLETISRNVKEIKDRLNPPKQTVPPVPLPTKTMDDEVEDELDEPHHKHQAEDTKYIVKCYKYLRKLALVESQYQFSEQFLNKNNCANKKCPVNNFYAQSNETSQKQVCPDTRCFCVSRN